MTELIWGPGPRPLPPCPLPRHWDVCPARTEPTESTRNPVNGVCNVPVPHPATGPCAYPQPEAVS